MIWNKDRILQSLDGRITELPERLIIEEINYDKKVNPARR